MNLFSIINNEFVPAGEAAVLVTDLAIQRGYGIFDFFKTINYKPVFLDDHLNRFYFSAETMRLPLQQNGEELKQLLLQLIEKNGIANSGIRITLTGGYSTDGYNIAQPNLIITQQALQLPAGINNNGIRLITHSHQRQFAHSKTLDYVMAVWLQPILHEQKADDVLYQHNGMVTECPRANFFIIDKEGCLVTTRNNILKGVIRKQVLEIANAHQLHKDADITIEDLMTCKEAFITSTTKNILPVTSINNKTIGSGKRGSVTQMLANELEQRING